MRLALFDFDGTLTTRDSLMPFLRHVAGTPRFLGGLALCSAPLLAYAAGRMPNDLAKERVISRFFRGRDIAEMNALGRSFAAGPLKALERPEMLEKLRLHRADGDVCVLVSASLGVYLDPWAREHGFEAALCSQLEVDADGRVTGKIVPRNCHGTEKARRIGQWLAGRSATHVTAYGDSRGDHDMLALADTAHWLGAPSRDPRRRGGAAPDRVAR